MKMKREVQFIPPLSRTNSHAKVATITRSPGGATAGEEADLLQSLGEEKYAKQYLYGFYRCIVDFIGGALKNISTATHAVKNE